MTDKDTITLPREVVEKAVKAFENGCPPTCEKGMVDSGGFHPWSQPALVPCPACLAFEHLRTALAAEQPKPEPVADEEAPRLWAWMREGWSADCGPWYEVIRNDQMTWRDRKGWTPLYTAPPALAAEQPKREFDHSIGADRFKVVRGIFWWHVKIGDSPTEHGKFRSSEAAQKMADDLLREFRNGAFVQNALAAEQPKPSEDIEALRREETT